MQKSDVLLEIRNIQASYKEYPALNNVSLDIKKNTVLGLVGESCSGKSTLAKVITGLLQADTGEVVFDGEMLYSKKKHLHRKQQCKQIQMVFQNPENQIIFNNVYDDIAFALKNLELDNEEIRIKTSLEKLRMDKYLKSPTYELSLGQKQRVTIAGVLAVNPKYIIFDEPTTMLDSEGKEDVYEIVKTLKKYYIM